MKQAQVKISFDTNSLLSILAEILQCSRRERDILLPIKATEIRKDTGVELVYRHQFDSIYSSPTETQILIPAQISDDGVYNISIFSNQTSQNKTDQIRLVKSSLITAFTKLEILAQYNKGQTFITVIDPGIFLSKQLVTSIPTVLIKLIADYFASALQVITLHHQATTPILPVLKERTEFDNVDNSLLGTQNDAETSDFCKD